jgi:predicted deoxyguanosinetriphosphate triphosphohydrolase
MYDLETKQYAQAQEEIISKLEYRITQTEDNRSESRDDVMRDYARVLYSSSFRRLQGKMQLLGIDANKFNRNRLTHSLEVAQIARSIAYDLELKHAVVSETASLAHDIGNPPFGHSGEVVLNKLCDKFGGYEGNAQAFRILRILEKKHHSYSGLNLTLRTLMGVTKYFYKKDSNPKKFLYNNDYDFLSEQLTEHGITVTKSIDAEIMDLADEIAYAAHDLEDALSFGMITLGEILYEFKISDKYSAAFDSFSKIVKTVQADAMRSHILSTSEEYSMIIKKEITSTIVNTLCRDIGLVNGILGYKRHSLLAEGLKKLLFKAILRKKDVQLYEKKGEKVIKGLFEVYLDDSFNKGNILLPPELRSLNEPKERLVTDYVSGMMDNYAIQEYEKYFGEGSSDKIFG